MNPLGIWLTFRGKLFSFRGMYEEKWILMNGDWDWQSVMNDSEWLINDFAWVSSSKWYWWKESCSTCEFTVPVNSRIYKLPNRLVTGFLPRCLSPNLAPKSLSGVKKQVLVFHQASSCGPNESGWQHERCSAVAVPWEIFDSTWFQRMIESRIQLYPFLFAVFVSFVSFFEKSIFFFANL